MNCLATVPSHSDAYVLRGSAILGLQSPQNYRRPLLFDKKPGHRILTLQPTNFSTTSSSKPTTIQTHSWCFIPKQKSHTHPRSLTAWAWKTMPFLLVMAKVFRRQAFKLPFGVTPPNSPWPTFHFSPGRLSDGSAMLKYRVPA